MTPRRIALGRWPTPFEKAPRLSAALGREIWFKREDLAGAALGGNKIRQLEWLLGEALAEGADAVLTTAGAQSNFCRALAGTAAKLGLACTLVLRGPAPSRQGNLLLDALFAPRSVSSPRPIRGALTHFWWCPFYVAQMRRAWSRSSLPRPYIWCLTSLSLVICPSVWPFDQGEVMAAATAALSLRTPVAKEATRLDRARSNHGSSASKHRLRTIDWKSATISRASTKGGTPLSTAATVTVSDLDSRSRPIARSRAMVRAAGVRVSPLSV
jgi:hypothetical protein